MLTLKSVVFLAGAIFSLVIAAYLTTLWFRRGRGPALVPLIAAFVLKAVAFWLSTPRGSELVDQVTGVANLGALAIHLSGGVLSAAALLVAVTYWTYPPDQARVYAKRWVQGLALVGLAMVVLWLIANVGTTSRDRHYLMKNAGRPEVAAYLLLYVMGNVVSMYGMARTAWRGARVTEQIWLRRGLWVTAAGALTYLGLGLNRFTALIAAMVNADPSQWEIVTVVSTSGGILLLGIGLTMPHWGPSLSAVASALTRYRQIRTLSPLWRDLCVRYPRIALAAPNHVADVLTLRDTEFRRYRRVIEIRDGFLASGVALSPADAPTLAAERIGQVLGDTPWPGSRTAAPADTSGQGERADPTDFDTELAWLLELARHYRRLRRTRTGHTTVSPAPARSAAPSTRPVGASAGRPAATEDSTADSGQP